MSRWIKRLCGWILGIRYDIELPRPYPMSTCWDCGIECPPDCWQKFVMINGKEYSVPHCDACMEKQEQEIRKHQEGLLKGGPHV